METLEKFLKQNQACKDGYDFAKNLTLEQFLKSCDRGDWILWLFQRSNPDSLRELTLTKGYCANTVRHKMKDARSIKALDATIAFGEGKISKKDLDTAADDAADAAAAVAAAAAAAAFAANTAAAAADADAAADAADAADADVDAKKKNQFETAEICRKYLPLKIWNINNSKN